MASESPLEGRRDRINAIALRFERAFERVRELVRIRPSSYPSRLTE